MSLTPEQILNLAAGAILAALGLAVVALRGRQAPAAAFGAIMLGWAGLSFVVAFWSDGPIQRTGFALSSCVVGTGFLALLALFPAPLSRAERRLLTTLLAGAAVLAVWWLWDTNATGLARPISEWDEGAPLERTGRAAEGLAQLLADVVVIAAGFFLPLRARRVAPEATATARSLALVAVGIALLVAGNGGVFRLFAQERLPLQIGVVPAVVLAGPPLLWAASVRGPHARLFRNVALATAAASLAGLLVGGVGFGLGWAAGRVLGALLFAYALLRGQIAGLDLKVRWGISRGTIAAAFIAVFFVASEGAQLLFGGENDVVGLFAAGALVFALAPLQRAADRLAETAVPVAATPAPAERSTPDAQERYRILLRRFLRDGRLTRDEDLALAHAAAGMGLTAHEALRLRHEVEDEVVRGASSGDVEREPASAHGAERAVGGLEDA